MKSKQQKTIAKRHKASNKRLEHKIKNAELRFEAAVLVRGWRSDEQPYDPRKDTVVVTMGELLNRAKDCHDDCSGPPPNKLGEFRRQRLLRMAARIAVDSVKIAGLYYQFAGEEQSSSPTSSPPEKIDKKISRNLRKANIATTNVVRLVGDSEHASGVQSSEEFENIKQLMRGIHTDTTSLGVRVAKAQLWATLDLPGFNERRH